MEFHNHTVTPKLHIAWIYSTYGFSSLYDLINSAFLTRKALHFSYIDAHKKSRENLGSNTLCYSRLYLTVLNDNKLPIIFSDVLDVWLNNNKIHQKGSTTSRYRYLIDTHIAPTLGFYNVREITANTVNTFLDRKLTSGRLDGEGGLSKSYVKSMMLIIKSALKYASDENWCSPLNSPIYKPSEEKKELIILDHNEQSKLESYLLSDINETTIGILLSLHAGLRIGEICALTWSDIDMRNKIIHIRHTVSRIRVSNGTNQTSTKLILDTPKTKDSKREIPISNFLFLVLQEEKRIAKSDYVVSNKKDFVSPRTYDYRFHKVLNCCNVSSINYHALRHTFATRCIEAGVDVKSLSEILGHSNVSITLNTYVHSSMDFKRNQIEKISPKIPY